MRLFPALLQPCAEGGAAIWHDYRILFTPALQRPPTRLLFANDGVQAADQRALSRIRARVLSRPVQRVPGGSAEQNRNAPQNSRHEREIGHRGVSNSGAHHRSSRIERDDRSLGALENEEVEKQSYAGGAVQNAAAQQGVSRSQCQGWPAALGRNVAI